ncbi:MAG: hypothetical protein K1W24_14710 [Lachnospiraceae bacterium]
MATYRNISCGFICFNGIVALVHVTMFKLLPDCRKAAMRLVCNWTSSQCLLEGNADCGYPLD